MNYKEAGQQAVEKLESIIKTLAIGRDSLGCGYEKFFQGIIDSVSPIKNELAQNLMKAEYEELKNNQ